MNKYIVAFISFHDHVLTQEIIEAKSEFDAAIIKMGPTLFGDETSLEDLKSLAFDCDSMISVYKLELRG